MTRSQTGVFAHGTYGFPVDITLSTSPDPPISLATVQSITLTLNRPAEAELAPVEIALSLPGAILDSDDGVIRWIPAAGDLAVPGVYHFTLTLVFTGPTQLTINGTMKVT